jgi:hypothetical protein
VGLTLAHEGGIDVEHIVGADVLCAVLFESSEAVPDAETPPDDDSVSCGRTGRGIGRIRTHCTRDSRTGNSSSGTIVCWARVEALLTSLPADDDADWSPCASRSACFRVECYFSADHLAVDRSLQSPLAAYSGSAKFDRPRPRSPPRRALDARQPRIKSTQATKERDDRADCKELGRSRHLCRRQ